MRKKIFWPCFLISAMLIILCSVVICAALSFSYENSAKRQLSAQLDVLTYDFTPSEAENRPNSYSEDYHVLIISPENEVLYDSQSEAVEDYSSLYDINQARETEEGEYIYNDGSYMRKVICRARMLADGTVIHISVSQLSIWGMLLRALPVAAAALLFAFFASLIFSKAAGKSIADKVNGISLEAPLESDDYEEFTPLLTKIEHYNRRMQTKLDKLKRRRSEFYAVTEGMSEGLIVLGKSGTILSINKAAQKLFNTDANCKGKNILTVYRGTAIQDIIERAWRGEHGETVQEISGREYRLSASPVTTDEKTAGVYVLAVDITEKAQAERMRREFTANVSHELKTPLHSIMGAAELMENGLMKPEDAPQFIERIHSEAKHLVELVNDIIRLSQLDENTDFPKETVPVKELASEIANALSSEAESRNVSLVIAGDEAKIYGSKRLIYEIIYNLCDNAIKYNVPGGKVEVLIQDGETVRIIVSDTGIGIPKEYQQRIFERFYRVDKSHSRSTGGTGLGLSIVKHAAEYHNAKITLDSEVGKGTSITIEFLKS
ncbi:MAG TPA: PAS domain-containing protein [Firmicutes bacterium]|nr:PAS domain-containing protein [Bacillota bacterium]